MKTLDKIAFPDVKLPFPITDSLLGIITWNVPASHKEHDMAAWLNGIIMQIATHTGVQACRKWDLCMMNQILWGSIVDHKPDLVVVDKSFSTNNILKGDKLNWKEFHTYTEVTHLPGHYQLNKTTWQKLFAMFEAQPTR